MVSSVPFRFLLSHLTLSDLSSSFGLPRLYVSALALKGEGFPSQCWPIVQTSQALFTYKGG